MLFAREQHISVAIASYLAKVLQRCSAKQFISEAGLWYKCVRRCRYFFRLRTFAPNCSGAQHYGNAESTGYLNYVPTESSTTAHRRV